MIDNPPHHTLDDPGTIAVDQFQDPFLRHQVARDRSTQIKAEHAGQPGLPEIHLLEILAQAALFDNPHR